MINLVFDACSLIYLTKIQMKEKLPRLGTIIVCKTVKNEIIADTDKFSDAQILKTNLEKGIIKELDLKLKQIPQFTNLGKGEKETIEICVKKEYLPITDDHQALNYAISCGLKPKTSETILLDFLREEIISYQEFKKVFKKLAIIKSLKADIIGFFNQEAKNIIKENEKNKIE